VSTRELAMDDLRTKYATYSIIVKPKPAQEIQRVGFWRVLSI